MHITRSVDNLRNSYVHVVIQSGCDGDMWCILMLEEQEITCCRTASRLLSCVNTTRQAAGWTQFTLSFYFSANGNPINHTRMALEWMHVLFVHRMASVTCSFLYQRHRFGSILINLTFLLQDLEQGWQILQHQMPLLEK